MSENKKKIIRILHNNGTSHFTMGQSLSSSLSIYYPVGRIREGAGQAMNYKVKVAISSYNMGDPFRQWAHKDMSDTVILNTKEV